MASRVVLSVSASVSASEIWSNETSGSSDATSNSGSTSTSGSALAVNSSKSS